MSGRGFFGPVGLFGVFAVGLSAGLCWIAPCGSDSLWGIRSGIAAALLVSPTVLAVPIVSCSGSSIGRGLGWGVLFAVGLGAVVPFLTSTGMKFDADFWLAARIGVVGGSYSLAWVGLSLFLAGAFGSIAVAHLTATLVIAAILWAPYGLNPLLHALDEGPRSELIQGVLSLHPLGPISDLCGFDWLRGAQSYRLSAIGSDYFFRYPPWESCSAAHALIGLIAGGAGWFLRRRIRKVPG